MGALFGWLAWLLGILHLEMAMWAGAAESWGPASRASTGSRPRGKSQGKRCSRSSSWSCWVLSTALDPPPHELWFSGNLCSELAGEAKPETPETQVCSFLQSRKDLEGKSAPPLEGCRSLHCLLLGAQITACRLSPVSLSLLDTVSRGWELVCNTAIWWLHGDIPGSEHGKKKKRPLPHLSLYFSQAFFFFSIGLWWTFWHTYATFLASAGAVSLFLNACAQGDLRWRTKAFW